MDKTIEPLLWVRAPKPTNPLINPTVQAMLKDKFAPAKKENK
jgi:hypothetical protein